MALQDLLSSGLIAATDACNATRDTLQQLWRSLFTPSLSCLTEPISITLILAFLVILLLIPLKILKHSPYGNSTLPGKDDKHSEARRESPYGNATLLQRITFSWLNPLLATGFKKQLEQDDVPELDTKDSAAFLSDNFRQKEAEDENRTRAPSIHRTIFLFIWRKAARNVLFAAVSATSAYFGPYVTNDFVNFLSDKKTRGLQSGYLLALAFLVAKMVETITERQWIFGARQLGMRLRAALFSQVYKKGLVLSSRSCQSHTSGEIINIMSVDIQRITDFIWYLNKICMVPIQVSLAIYILHTSIGLGSVAALATTLTVMACNIPLSRIQKRYQSKIMQAKDDRMKLTSEVLRNMKSIKLQAWDKWFLNKIESLRKIEYDWIWKSLRLGALSAFVFWGSPAMISTIIFGTCVLMGIQLTPGKVMAVLATFRKLQDPIFNLPDLVNVIVQAKVSADRLASFFQEEEIQKDDIEYIEKNQAEFAIEITNGKFNWNSQTLNDIDLKVRRGMKVAICGTVGSGKSSLLSCILGEMKKLSGQVKISGTIAYVPQSPWILTGNVRENILFENPYGPDKYERTIKACALVKDFELFPEKDLTQIGERGINMSGGQKQRIQIARAVYQDADIYLLDDPFSAVDAHTGTRLFADCLEGILKGKTILCVTHQAAFLQAADLILVMRDGRIAQAGKFDVMEQDKGFQLLVGAHKEAPESILTIENSNRTHQGPTTDREFNKDAISKVELPLRKHEAEHALSLEISKKDGKLVQDEKRETGSIGKEVYWSYITTVKDGTLIPIILLVQLIFHLIQAGINSQLVKTCSPTSDAEPVLNMDTILRFYVPLAVGSSFCVLFQALLVAVAGLWTAEKLFSNMLHSIMQARMAFFDSTPTGRILNQASTDQSVLDLEIAGKLSGCAFSIIQFSLTILLMSEVGWVVLVIFILAAEICRRYQQYYMPTARELARLSGIQRSPVLHYFAESVSGTAVIRAFKKEDSFTRGNLKLVDNHSKPWFHNVSAMQWLSFRQSLSFNFVFALLLVILVSLPEGMIDPCIAGLAVTYGIDLNVLLVSIALSIRNADLKIISVERILQYSKLASEAAPVLEKSKPPSNWPETGEITFRNLQIRYAEHLPHVLKNIDCTFPGRQKIGVVGRTGSGKSTLIQAIFRIVEPSEGSIIIDGVDISAIDLHDLRSRLSIVPQDPAMFEGTVRGNLDPLEQYSDEQIWEALDKCELGETVRAKEKQLDYAVMENGENWSMGQRQLFCLGRVLLKKSSILVLDEATASIDSATEGVIQKIISQEFKNKTVVTIAHRIHTVTDSDLVLVLSDGQVAEFDNPNNLLAREDSSFSKLAREYSMRS